MSSDEDDDDEHFEYPDYESNGGPEHDGEVLPDNSATAVSIAAVRSEPPSNPGNVNGDAIRPEETAVAHPSLNHASPDQLELLYASGLAGDLDELKRVVGDITSTSELEDFTLVNDASPRTGLTVVHASASRGHLDALKWRMCPRLSLSFEAFSNDLHFEVIEVCGGIPDLEDKEGEVCWY